MREGGEREEQKAKIGGREKVSEREREREREESDRNKGRVERDKYMRKR